MKLTTDDCDEDYAKRVIERLDSTIALLNQVRDSGSPEGAGIFITLVMPEELKGDSGESHTLIMGGGTEASYRLLFNIESGYEMMKEALRETMEVDSHWDHQVLKRLKEVLKGDGPEH